MKRLLALSAVTSLLVAVGLMAWAGSNLNSSRSNVYRMVHDTTAVTPAQATAILAELDKIGPTDEATLKRWLPANFKKHGVQADRIKKIVIRPADKMRKQTTILLLTNLADEPQAIAVSDSATDERGKELK